VTPGIIVWHRLFLASGLFPAPLQCSRHQAVFRLDSGIRPGRTRCRIMAPLETLLPRRLQLGALGPSRVFCSATQLSRGGLEHVPHLVDNETIQEGPGATPAQRRPRITHTPAAAVAQAMGLATVCRDQAPPAAPTPPGLLTARAPPVARRGLRRSHDGWLNGGGSLQTAPR
jgi:hypothetical protein